MSTPQHVQINADAARLAQEITAFLQHRGESDACIFIALAKLIGQTTATMDRDQPAELLYAAFMAARDEMRLRQLALRLADAGLASIMPACPA